MVYKITKSSVFKDNPELNLIDEMASLTDQQAKYVLLAFDYGGPFSQLPSEANKKRSAILAGYKDASGNITQGGRDLVSGKVAHVNEAVKWFLSIQKNENRELLNAYDNMVSQMKDFMNRKKEDEKDWNIAIKLIKELPIAMAKKKELQKMLAHSLDMPDVTVGKNIEEDSTDNLSTLDQLNIKDQENV